MRWLLFLIPMFTFGQMVFVERVIDGDTFVLDDGERVRFLYINTPERGEEGYKEAKDFVIEHTEGRYVEIETQGRGYYGRVLAVVCVDGMNLNKKLYCLGLAEMYRGTEWEYKCEL